MTEVGAAAAHGVNSYQMASVSAWAAWKSSEQRSGDAKDSWAWSKSPAHVYWYAHVTLLRVSLLASVGDY